MAWVYILESLRDGRYYIGSTANLHARLKHHRSGFTHSTYRFGDIQLVFSQQFPTIQDARKIERRIKHLKRKDYIQQIIQDGVIKMRP